MTTSVGTLLTVNEHCASLSTGVSVLCPSDAFAFVRYVLSHNMCFVDKSD